MEQEVISTQKLENNVLLKFLIRFFRSHRLMHHVFHHLAAELICLAGGQHADAARGQGDGINLLKAAALNHNIKAEPVTAIETSGGVEAYGSRDRSLKILPRNGQDAVADVLRPGIASNQRLVEVLAFK